MPGTRLRRPPGVLALVLGLAVGAAGTVGIVTSAQERSAEVERVDVGAGLVEAVDLPAENYLIVGSDSRAGVDPNAENADQIGSADEITGNRADTIMILRREREGGAYLLSIPRDLWVDIAGTDDEGKINGAFNGGPSRLAETISQSLGIPINHYVEVDFVGFTTMVDAIGGVELCFANPARDRNSGLSVDPGCQRLDGVQALAYSRSRYYEEFIDGDWRDAGLGADLGRIDRQQNFIRQAVTQVLVELEGNPFRLSELISSVGATVRIDEGADPVESANALRAAANAGLQTYSLPVEFITEDGQDALALDDGADEILQYFRGAGPPPPQVPAPVAPTDD